MWVRPPKTKRFHWRDDLRKVFLCGEAVPQRMRAATENDFASYSDKCETCLIKFAEREMERNC